VEVEATWEISDAIGCGDNKRLLSSPPCRLAAQGLDVEGSSGLEDGRCSMLGAPSAFVDSFRTYKNATKIERAHLLIVIGCHTDSQIQALYLQSVKRLH
jgi:hypothetical protein